MAMRGHSGRLQALERLAYARTQRRGEWSPPYIEQRPGENVDDRAEELRRQAEAAGWRPADGPYVIIVVVPE